MAALAVLAAALAAAPEASAQAALTAEVTTRVIVGGEALQVDAGEGATIAVSLRASAPVTVAAADVSFLAEPGASRVAPSSVMGSGTDWEARLTVAASHAEGPIRFWITARAASPATGSVTVTHGDVAGHIVEVDRTRPAMTAELTSPTTTVVRLNEALPPLVAPGRELDAERWCITDSWRLDIISTACVPPTSTGPTDTVRDVAVVSATVTRAGASPEVTLEHARVHNVNTLHVIFDPGAGNSPRLFADSALNAPAAQGDGRIWARPSIADTPDVPFRPLYWGSDYMAILFPTTLTPTFRALVPGEWRVESGAATPDDTSNDLATRTTPAGRAPFTLAINDMSSPHHDPDAPRFVDDYRLESPRLLYFAEGVAVPDRANLYVTYLLEGERRLHFANGPELTREAQVAVNPTSLPASMGISVERDSGSGFAEISSPARAGDRLVIDVMLRVKPATGDSPTYSFHGATAAPMTRVATDATGRTWTASLTVGATTTEGPVEFDITSSQFGARAVAYDESDVTDGSSAYVDRTAPSVRTAVQVGDRELHVAFDEPVGHTSLTGLFTVTRDSAPVAATGTVFNAALGAYVTTLAANAPTGSTHVLTTSAGAITDAAGNAAPTTFTVTADSAAPAATALTLNVLRDGGSGLAERTGAHAEHARPGDTVRATLGLSEPTHPLTAPTIRFFDARTPVAMSGEPGGTSWSADHEVPPTRTGDGGATVYPVTPEGAVTLDILALDYSGNALEVSESAITDSSSATVDATPPARPSVAFTQDARGVALTFAEPLDAATAVPAAFTVKDASDETVAQPSPAAYTESTRSVLVSLPAVPTEAYTVEIAGTVTDRAGNAYMAGDVPVPVPDTAPPVATKIATESDTATVVTFDEEVRVDGNAAQRSRHWTVTDDSPTGGATTAAEGRAVTAVEVIGEDGSAAASGTRIRLTHASLGQTDSTPTVAYAPVTSDPGGVGAVTLGRVADATQLSNALAAFAAREASDGAPPRAVSAAFTGASAISVTLSEPVESEYVHLATVTPGLGTLDVSTEGTALRITGSAQAADGTSYTVAVPRLVTDRACEGAGEADMCVPNAFSGGPVSAVHDDTYAPALLAGTARFSTDSLLVFRVSEALAAATLSGITVAPSLGTLTVTQVGMEVRIAFTGTPSGSYTITIPATVTDTADPPNRLGSLTAYVTYKADTVAPEVAGAALTAADTITVTFSEPVRGTTSLSDWVVSTVPNPVFKADKSVLNTDFEVSTFGVSAPGHEFTRGLITIPADRPVSQVFVHFAGVHTDTIMFVRHAGSTLQDRAGNPAETVTDPGESTQAEDRAGPSPETVFVRPEAPRQRQGDRDDIGDFNFGSLIVRPGDRVTFTIRWNAVDQTQEPSLSDEQFRERLANPTIEGFDGNPVAMARVGAANAQATRATLTVPEGAPEGPFMPAMRAVDGGGNVGSSTSAYETGECDTAVSPSVPFVERPGLNCAYDLTRFANAQNPKRLERIYPVVDATPPSVESARTASATTTVVTLSEPVGHAPGTAAERAAHWSMEAGSTQARVEVTAVDVMRPFRTSSPENYELTLTHGEVGSDATPTLTYSLGADAGRVVDRPRHDLASIPSLSVADGIAPSLLTAVFGAAPSRTLTLTFDEALAAASVSASTISIERDGETLAGTAVAHDAGSPEVVTVEFPPSPQALDGQYTLRVRGGASGVTDAADTPNRLAEDITREVVLDAEAPLVVSAVTRLGAALATSLTGHSVQGGVHTHSGSGAALFQPPVNTPLESPAATTVVTLSEAVTVTESSPGTPATASEISARWGLRDSCDAVDIDSVAVSGSTVTIAHDPPCTTAAALTMTYSDAAGAGRLVGADGSGLRSPTARTTDGVAPLWSARLAGAGSVVVTFSEPVRIAEESGSPVPPAGRWFMSNYGDAADTQIDPRLFTESGSRDVGVTDATLDDAGLRLTLDLADFVPGSGGFAAAKHGAFGSTSLPYAKYYPGAPGLTGARAVTSMIEDLAGNDLVPRAVRTADGIRPTLTVSSFDGTTLVATASRPLLATSVQPADLALVGPGTSEARRAPSAAPYDAGTRTLTLTFSPALTVPGIYRLALATGAQGAVTGDVRDTVTTTHPYEEAAGNLLDTAGATATLASASAPTVTGARTVSPTLTRVTLSAPVDGRTVAAQWGLEEAGGAGAVAVTGVAAGSVASVAPGAAAEPAMGAAVATLTLLHAAQDTDWRPRLSYNPDAGGVGAADRLRDVSDRTLAAAVGASRPTADDGAPPAPASARFTGRGLIELSFSEPLHEPSVRAAAYAVTAPSGADAPLRPGQVGHAPGATTVALPLAAAATEHGAYRVTVSGLRDAASPQNACAPAACAIDADRSITTPVASSLALSVLDSMLKPKAAHAETAVAGDILRLRLELSGVRPSPDVPPVPALLAGLAIPGVGFYGGTLVQMTDVSPMGATNSVWTADYAVPVTPQREGQPEFRLQLQHGFNFLSLTQADLTAGGSVTVDSAPPSPSAAAADPLYTRKEAAGATAGLGSAAPARTGESVLVVLTASEPLAGAAAADATIAGAAATALVDHASRMLDPALPANTYVWSRPVAATDAEGPLEFSIAVRDAVGNTGTVTHEDIRADSDDATGYRLAIDRSPPVVASLAFTSQTGLRLEFDGGVTGVPDTLALERTPTGGPAEAVQATVAHTDGEAAATLTVPEVARFHPSEATWRLTVPDAVTDLAGHKYATPGDPVPVSTAGAPSITRAETNTLFTTHVLLSQAVTDGGARDAALARWTVNGQPAENIRFTAVDGTPAILLGHPRLPDSDSTPVVKYSPAGGDAGRLVDTASRVFYLASATAAEPLSVTAADGLPPQATRAFTGPGEITVTTDAPYTGKPAPTGVAFPPGVTHTVAHPSPTTIVITLGGTVSDGTYKFSLELSDTRTPANTHTVDLSLSRIANLLPIQSARTLSHTQVEVALAPGVSRAGTADLEALRWAVYPSGPACGSLAGDTITPSSVSSVLSSAILRVTLTMADGILDASGGPDTAAQPTVSYARGDGAAEFRDSTGSEIGDMCRMAQDKAPPVPHSAKTSAGAQGNVVTMGASEAIRYGQLAPGTAPQPPHLQFSLLPGGRAADAAVPSSVSFADEGRQITLSFGPTGINPLEEGTLVRYDASLARAHRISDLRNNVLTTTTDVTLADGISPAISSARTASATTTEVAYDEDITLVGDVKGLWTLKVSGMDTEYPVSSAAIKDGSPRVLVLTHADATTPLAHTSSSTATVSYEGDESCNCGVTDAAGNHQADYENLAVADGIAPSVASAATSSATRTVVTLDEAAAASSSPAANLARHWSLSETVDGSAVAREVTAAAISSAAVTLTHEALDSTGATPSVTYTASVDSDGDGDIDAADEATRVADAAGNALAGSTVTATDGAPPTIRAEFATATAIRVSLSEPVQRPGDGLLSASNWMVSTTDVRGNMLRGTNPVEYAAGSAEREITLHLTTAESAVTAHTVTLPTGITDRASPPPTNAYAGPAELTVAPLASISFTARATAADRIEVTFDLPVRRVAADPLPELMTGSWLVHPTREAGPRNLLIPVVAVSEPADNKVTLTLSQVDAGHRSTSKTPLVVYDASTPEIESTSGIGLVRGTSAVASDAAPPTFQSARATSTTSIEVTMSEGVKFAGTGFVASRALQWTVAAPGSTYRSPDSATISGSKVTLEFAQGAAWATGAPPAANYLERDGIASERATLVVDSGGLRLAASSVQAEDGIPPVIEAATVLSSTRIDVTLSEPARFADAASTAAQMAGHWSVTAGGTPRGAASAEISTSAGRSTVTVTVAGADRWTGDQAPTVSYSDTPADGGRVADARGNLMAARLGVPTTDQSAPELESARTADLGRTVLEFSRPVALTAGTDAQIRGHWSMRGDDPDGAGPKGAPAIAVNSVSVDAADPTRVVLGHGGLSGSASTPTVSYDPDTSTGGRLALAANAASQAEQFTDREAADGIPPRLVGDPELVGWGPEGVERPDNAGPNYGVQDAIRLTFDEPISITQTVQGNPPQGLLMGAPTETNPQFHGDLKVVRDKLVAFQPQFDARNGGTYRNIPPGNTALGEQTALQVPERWLPASSYLTGAHLDGNVLTLRLPSEERHHPVAFELHRPGPAVPPNLLFYDLAGNAHIPDVSRGHERFTLVRDLAAPTFTAHVDSARQVRVVYDEPVRISDGRSIERLGWRVDTTPANSKDNDDMPANQDTYVAPSSVAYSFDEFEGPELWHHGDLGRQSRLTILLTMPTSVVTDTGPTPVPGLDAAADLNVVSTAINVEDARGNAEARDTATTTDNGGNTVTTTLATRTYEYRPGGTAPSGLDTAAPAAASLEASVERPSGAQGEFAPRAGPFAHHAREGDRVRVGVTLDGPVPLAGARPTATSTGPVVSDTIVPRLVAGGSSAAMAAAAPPPFRVVIPVTVTDQDGTPFAAGTAHEATYAPAPPSFSNARFESPTRLLIDVSEPLDDTTLTPDTPATSDTALVRGSVHVEGLGTFDVRRETGRVVVTTAERAVPGTAYTIQISGAVTDADGVAAAAASLGVTYPEAPALSARFTERPEGQNTHYLIGIRASEWLDFRAVPNFDDHTSVDATGATPASLPVSSANYAHPYLIIRLMNPAPAGTYDVTLPPELQTFAGTPVPATVRVERFAGGFTPPGAPTASNVRFFGPQHIQLDLDQQPDPATLGNIEVEGLGVRSWSRDGLTVTLALEGRADRVAWEGTWTVPASMANGDPFAGELEFGVAAPDSAGNVSDIGPEDADAGTARVIADTGAPTFTARAVTDTRTSVTFGEPVRGVISAAEWCVAGAAAAGISADGVEFAPAIRVDDGLAVTAGQSFTISHAASGGAAPTVEYSPGAACSPAAPSG